jgi:hypothetical protein
MGKGLDVSGYILGRGKRIFYAPHSLDRIWSPSSHLSNGYWGLFPPGLKRLGRKADHALLSSAEIKNGGAIPPLPTRLRGVVFN